MIIIWTGGQVGIYNIYHCCAVYLVVKTVTAIIHHPPKHNPCFLCEFSEFIYSIVLTYDRPVITGGFNIHVNDLSNSMTV